MRYSLFGFDIDLIPVFLGSLLTLIFITIMSTIRKIIKNNTESLTEYIFGWIAFVINTAIKNSFLGAISVRKYVLLMLKSSKYMFLNVPSRDNINIGVEKIYIPLKVDCLNASEKEYLDKNILSIGSRIIVLGEPGSGKTSMLKKTFREECKRASFGNTGTKLPVFVELKNVKLNSDDKKINEGEKLYNYIRDSVSDTSAYKLYDAYNNYVNTKGIILFLDGLDEVATDAYGDIQKAIIQLSEMLSSRSNNNAIILSMRTQFFYQVKNEYTESFPYIANIQPFSPSDIYNFLLKWEYKDKSENNVSRVYKDLTDRPTLREMCRNPLILSMYVAEDQATGHLLAPDSRTQFYKSVTDELLIRRRAKQLKDDKSITPEKERREELLGKLALEHLLDSKQNINSLSLKRAYTFTKEVYRCSESEAENVFNRIMTETGIIIEEKPDESYRFIHLTFCEFLAAFEAVNGCEDGWVNLINLHWNFQTTGNSYLKSRLIEVIPFACGLLQRKYKQKAISNVFDLSDNRLLARCFMETKLYDHDVWPIFIANASGELKNTTEESWDEKWLNDLHLLNVVVEDAKISKRLISYDSDFDMVEFISSLVSRQHDSLKKLFIAYATHDAAAAFRIADTFGMDISNDLPEVVINSCDQEDFLGLLKDKMIKNQINVKSTARLLVEAALKSKYVPMILCEMKRETLITIDMKSKIYKRLKSLLGDSFYLQCLVLSDYLVDNDSIQRQDHFLNAILTQRATPPRFMKRNILNLFDSKNLARISIFCLVALLTIFVSELLILTNKSNSPFIQTDMYNELKGIFNNPKIFVGMIFILFFSFLLSFLTKEIFYRRRYAYILTGFDEYRLLFVLGNNLSSKLMRFWAEL